MFDRCGRWRRKLQRQADGTLSARQWGALDDHLSQCAGCRAIAEADRALRETVRTHTGLLDQRAAAAFDDHVVAHVALERGVRTRTSRRRMPGPRPESAARRAPSVGFFSQIAAGACAAAAVTAVCLVPALHPAAARADWRMPIREIVPSLPPVPLESLLQAASPCAALLWASPHAQPAGFQGSPRANIHLPARARGPRPRQEMPSVHDKLG